MSPQPTSSPREIWDARYAAAHAAESFRDDRWLERWLHR
jgi:hypothetical protein